MKNIQHIIFDLGGVIIDLDMKRTISEMSSLCNFPFEKYYTQAKQVALFDEFDKGLITPKEFFRGLKKELGYRGPEEELVKAWNAMLLNVPEHRLDVLVKAKQQYNTFLLSNTNETHVAVFERELYLEHGVKNFSDYFDRTYYSCRIGMRKPDREIFELVLKENELNPEETVFIDDSIQHVQGAGQCGIRSYLLPPNKEIGEFLTELKLL